MASGRSLICGPSWCPSPPPFFFRLLAAAISDSALPRTEHLKKAEKRQKELKMPDLLEANPALKEPLQIPGLQYLEIQMTGWRFQLHMVNQLSWRAFS